MTGSGRCFLHKCYPLCVCAPALQNEQKQTIRRFREGLLNLLISTSVAEEGLDIPECNLVVRYGLLTNEIAMQQASGRARAPNSVYSVVALETGREIKREITNECLEDLCRQAIHEVQQMNPRDFQRQVKIASLGSTVHGVSSGVVGSQASLHR